MSPNTKRTGGMTAIAVLNFIFGGGNIWAFLFGLVTANSLMTNPMMTRGANGTQLEALLLAALLLSLTSAGAAIVSGIGILKLASWSRTWTLIYAILGILASLIGLLLTLAMEGLVPEAKQTSPVSSLAIGCMYPAILLYLISTTTWKETFRKNAVEVA